MSTIEIHLPNVEQRLLAKRAVTDAGCWEWNGYRDRDGYGFVSIAGREWRVHRLAAFMWLEFDLTSSLFVCHSCDNPPCFNPEHLFPGTPADNTADCVAKGRHRTPRKYPATRSCNICGTEYAPDRGHRGRSIVCSKACLVKWRSVTQKGRGAKLSPDQVEALRLLIAAGHGYREAAAEFGVSGSTAHRALNGRRA